ncbi:GerAB/ArcD/ProY family transporter [Paenibacillus koleovorans]|uniref:GerAB/ArcD/ProY family transporter n=1 Tax=Paenibacillus koleovorans TaxID=121608 RepID=UPI000FD6D524|nr:endospore germination permease [Paenibacillus koleovorans]
MHKGTKRTITAIQASVIITSTIIGVGVLSLPTFATKAAGTGGPLITLLGVMVAMLGVVLIIKLGQRFPQQTIIQYADLLIGKALSKVGSILIILFFAVLTSLAAREFGEVVVTTVLKKTPLDVTVVVMLLLAAFSTRHDLDTFTYIHQFYVPIIIFPGLLIIVLSLKNSNPLFLLPVMDGGGTFMGMSKGVLTVASLFQASFVITMVMPKLRVPGRAMKAGIWAILISGGLYLLIVISTISVFGPEETNKLLWPTLELAKTTSLPANILERLDAAFLAVWVTAVFTTLFSTYYFTIHSLSELFKLKDHRMFTMLLLPFVFVIAMLPQNVLQMYAVIDHIGQLGLVVTILYPLLLLLVAMIRKKRGHMDAESKG